MDPVIIIDSGCGGLTIFDAIRKKLPEWPLIYCFDNEAFPYGEKCEDAITQRMQFCVQQLHHHVTPALIVIACNTASTIALPTLRTQFSVPIVGVVPAIKPAAMVSKNRCVGLLATPATISRDYTARLISSYAQHCQVICLGSSKMVKLAEDKLQGYPVCLKQLKEILSPFIDREIVPDHIVLGCTHFPLLKEELIKSAYPFNIQWLDSGNAIAQRVETLLSNTQFTYKRKLKHQAFYTKKQKFNPALKRFFAQHDLNMPQLLF